MTFRSKFARDRPPFARTVVTGSRRFNAGSTTPGRGSIMKVKASIVEGVVVFLSLFDENPAVYRAFCPPREAYIHPPKPGEPRPLPPLEDLLETGHVLGPELSRRHEPGAGARPRRDAEAGFPARGPAAHSEDRRQSEAASWRDILFVADEYHAFATVGETDPTGDERAFALVASGAADSRSSRRRAFRRCDRRWAATKPGARCCSASARRSSSRPATNSRRASPRNSAGARTG